MEPEAILRARSVFWVAAVGVVVQAHVIVVARAVMYQAILAVPVARAVIQEAVLDQLEEPEVVVLRPIREGPLIPVGLAVAVVAVVVVHLTEPVVVAVGVVVEAMRGTPVAGETPAAAHQAQQLLIV